ncbi:MAG: START domain-containing protein [Polyangiales bacterium]
MRHDYRAFALGATLVSLSSAHTTSAQADASWRTIREEQGIVVSTEEPPPPSLLSFRGSGALRASVLHVLAIILDDDHATEWAKNADVLELVRALDARTQIIYSRSHQRWPVKDRDLVMKRTVEVLTPGSAYRVRLVCVPGEKARVPEVIRIGRCETTFTLRRIDEQSTRVDYATRTEPGGNNPDWLVRLASRSIPFDTLLALRKQVERTRGRYAEVMQRWAVADK